MNMDIRIPHFDSQKDFMAFLRFLDNRKEYEAYMKQLDTKIAAFVKAAKLYGKAKDIEKKHEEAELWAKRAEHDYAEREERLTAGEKALIDETRERRAKMKNRETQIEQMLQTGAHALTSREVSLKALEAEVNKREELVAKTEKAADKATQAAVKARRAADDMVTRMKAATSTEKD